MKIDPAKLTVKALREKVNAPADMSDYVISTLSERYLLHDGLHITETIPEMWDRVAKAISSIEKDSEKYRKLFRELLETRIFLPNSPCLMNAGTTKYGQWGQLCACFVLEFEDNLESILGLIKDTGFIHASGGGTGFSLSNIRPSKDTLSSGGNAAGPIAVIRILNELTQYFKQSGRRRGANLASLRVNHPDILDYITTKEDKKGFKNFNLSVLLTDEFFDCLKNGEDFPLVNPRTGQPVAHFPAKLIFDEICRCSHECGDPGVLYETALNRDNACPEIGDVSATNPCGEVCLPTSKDYFAVCDLGSIDLSKLVHDGAFDFYLLKRAVELGVRFLDNVIDVTTFPMPQIEKFAKYSRAIGLGVMGLADALLKMNIKYGSTDSFAFAEECIKKIQESAELESFALAEEKGKPEFTKKFLGGDPHDEKDSRGFRRNAQLLSIAPTGTLAFIAETSHGIEPNFAWEYERRICDPSGDKKITVKHPLWGTNIPKECFVTAHDLSWKEHIDMQAVFQKHVDGSISKTINIPNNCSIEDIKSAILYGYKSGCKGLTVFRDRSLPEQVMTATAKTLKKAPRPDVVEGKTVRHLTGCGDLYVTKNEIDGEPFETFISLGKGGACPAMIEAVGKLISLCLRTGIHHSAIEKQLRNIVCVPCSLNPDCEVTSCPDAIARVLEETSRLAKSEIVMKCERCDSLLVGAGCLMCWCCGYSLCS